MGFPQPTDAILNWTELRWFNLDSRQMSTHLLAAEDSPNMDHDTNTHCFGKLRMEHFVSAFVILTEANNNS